jgi:hypothetical protein
MTLAQPYREDVLSNRICDISARGIESVRRDACCAQGSQKPGRWYPTIFNSHISADLKVGTASQKAFSGTGKYRRPAALRKPKRKITRGIVANFPLATIQCCLWLLGVAGIVLHSVSGCQGCVANSGPKQFGAALFVSGPGSGALNLRTELRWIEKPGIDSGSNARQIAMVDRRVRRLTRYQHPREWIACRSGPAPKSMWRRSPLHARCDRTRRE